MNKSTIEINELHFQFGIIGGKNAAKAACKNPTRTGIIKNRKTVKTPRRKYKNY